MTKSDGKSAQAPGGAAAARAQREARLAAALRENLKRRKAQQRGRAALEDGPRAAGGEGAEPGPADGEADRG